MQEIPLDGFRREVVDMSSMIIIMNNSSTNRTSGY